MRFQDSVACMVWLPVASSSQPGARLRGCHSRRCPAQLAPAHRSTVVRWLCSRTCTTMPFCDLPLCQLIALLVPPYVVQFWEEKVRRLVWGDQLAVQPALKQLAAARSAQHSAAVQQQQGARARACSADRRQSSRARVVAGLPATRPRAMGLSRLARSSAQAGGFGSTPWCARHTRFLSTRCGSSRRAAAAAPHHHHHHDHHHHHHLCTSAHMRQRHTGSVHGADMAVLARCIVVPPPWFSTCLASLQRWRLS